MYGKQRNDAQEIYIDHILHTKDKQENMRNLKWLCNIALKHTPETLTIAGIMRNVVERLRNPDTKPAPTEKQVSVLISYFKGYNAAKIVNIYQAQKYLHEQGHTENIDID